MWYLELAYSVDAAHDNDTFKIHASMAYMKALLLGLRDLP